MSPSRRCAIARGGSPPRCAAWQVAHAESFACRGSVRGTVRDRAAHPARYHDRAAITRAHYPGGAMGTSRPTAITHDHGARRITRAARCSAAGSPGSRPTAITPAHYPRSSPPEMRYSAIAVSVVAGKTAAFNAGTSASRSASNRLSPRKARIPVSFSSSASTISRNRA